MNAPTVVKIPCECGGNLRFTETGSGSISASCPDCKVQRFYKSARAVAAFKARYLTTPTDTPAAQPAEKPKSGGFLDEL